MLNKVMLIGRLGKDPELRYSSSGSPIANMTLATDESYTDRDGNKVDRTEWHKVVVFQRMAENCANYLTKGSLVYVEGSLQTRKWQDQQGQDRYTTEVKAQRVQFLDRRGDRAQAQGGDESFGDRPRSKRPPMENGPRPSRQPQAEEDYGPAFPSEAATMDDMPF